MRKVLAIAGICEEDVLFEIVEMVCLDLLRHAFDDDKFAVDPDVAPFGMPRDLARFLEIFLPERRRGLRQLQVDVTQRRVVGRLHSHVVYQLDDFDVDEIDVHQELNRSRDGKESRGFLS